MECWVCPVVFVAGGVRDDVNDISGEDGYGASGGESCVCVWAGEEFPVALTLVRRCVPVETSALFFPQTGSGSGVSVDRSNFPVWLSQ